MKREINLQNNTQKCNKCGEWKPLEEFTKHKNKKYGIETSCLECGKKRVKKWREDNPEKKKQLDKKYVKENREKVLSKKREYYYKNKEDLKNKAFNYYQENKEKVKENVNKYRQTEKGRMVKRNSSSKRRAILRDADEGVRTEWLMTLKEQTNNICPLCDCEMNDIFNSPNQFTLDHIIPICCDGKHSEENIRIICRDCNIKRPKDGSDI
ncbi:MAG TPA: HNH endonuclease signature motif containing protein [Candidatus Paceibacterota bacterium]|nr:HNH endonuclease signature motif containing protein [Candidatus Paceibacterota bacterium]